MKIEYGYDKHVRSWNICVFDENGVEVASQYVGNREDANIVIADFMEDYKTTDVKKIKAY